jgi:hypothetical protein
VKERERDKGTEGGERETERGRVKERERDKGTEGGEREKQREREREREMWEEQIL